MTCKKKKYSINFQSIQVLPLCMVNVPVYMCNAQIDSVELKDLHGRQGLTTLLEGLDVRRCLTSLQVCMLLYYYVHVCRHAGNRCVCTCMYCCVTGAITTQLCMYNVQVTCTCVYVHADTHRVKHINTTCAHMYML